VAFARAIYCDADVYLLDDPLSAVDAHVGQFLFHEGIRTCLAGKTRILVTHQVHLLPFFDKIIVMDNGQVKACGKYCTVLYICAVLVFLWAESAAVLTLTIIGVIALQCGAEFPCECVSDSAFYLCTSWFR
jgi:ABC-type multidrug transport system fused ATPase/permease subunit